MTVRAVTGCKAQRKSTVCVVLQQQDAMLLCTLLHMSIFATGLSILADISFSPILASIACQQQQTLNLSIMLLTPATATSGDGEGS